MDLVKQNRLAYNAIADHFSVTRTALWSEFHEFTPFLAKSQRVLDWGCGNGRLLAFLADRDVDYYGTDQSAKLLAHAKRIHADLIKKGRAHFYNTAWLNKKFPKEYFDIVFMVASFFHLPTEKERLALLKKTYRELKTGGHLCMTLWNLESDWANKKKTGWTVLGENDYIIPWKDQAGKIVADRYYHHFSPEEISQLLEQTGFKVEKISFSEASKEYEKGGRNMVIVAAKPKSQHF